MANSQGTAGKPGAKQYQYLPLAQNHGIRLLKLAEDSGSIGNVVDRIDGDLVHVSLDDLAHDSPPFKYLAISYCWGGTPHLDRLWLSDKEYLPITKSAAYILRCIAPETHLWIDSVCINQKDTEEKSIQFSYMWGIYKLADCVLAWPGGPEDGGDLAMEMLFDFKYALITKHMTGRELVVLPRREISFRPGLPTVSWRASYTSIPQDFTLDRERWAAMSRFLDRPWFRRVWVIQEIVAAKEVNIVMGTRQRTNGDTSVQWKWLNTRTIGHVADWESLTDFIKELEDWGFLYLLDIKEDGRVCDLPTIPAALGSLNRIKALKPAVRNKRPNFQDNLLLTMAAEATDPRDKIFAVRSMSLGSLTTELEPNYKLAVQDVYSNATRHLVLRDQYLSVLHMAGIGWSRRMQGLPSWVPDYSRTRRVESQQGEDLVLGQIAVSALFATASIYLSNIEAQVVRSWSTPRMLYLSSIVVDEVKVVC